MSDELGPRMAGGHTAVRGRLGLFLRERQAARQLTDADLLRGGAASHPKNLGEYLAGKRFPDNRMFQQLIDSFRNVGNGLYFQEVKRAEGLFFEEAPAWDRYTSGQPGWVSETGLSSETGATRSTRTPRNGGGTHVSKSKRPRQHHKETAGEGGFEPPIV